jgi:hypothetical protein
MGPAIEADIGAGNRVVGSEPLARRGTLSISISVAGGNAQRFVENRIDPIRDDTARA